MRHVTVTLNNAPRIRIRKRKRIYIYNTHNPLEKIEDYSYIPPISPPRMRNVTEQTF